MRFVIRPDQLREADRKRVGGKNFALALMARSGMRVPRARCISTGAYAAYVDETGIRQQIALELKRKDFAQMRWEEIWDTALRVRNLFIRTPMPESIRDALAAPLEAAFGNRAVVVRSSAPGEDSARSSFAGLHDSFVNIRGISAILEHIRKVWASLWSDRALLYRRELGLDMARSAMAVAVQEIVTGVCSGVVFGKSPNHPGQAVIEAVYGLNQGLVDGDVAPDRWVLDRETGDLISHTPARRERVMMPSDAGVALVPLEEDRRRQPPLDSSGVRAVYRLARKAESLFGGPQDAEWTFKDGTLYVLQSRPITTGRPEADAGDLRPWHLSQHRSLENLKTLCGRVREELLPEMAREAQKMADHPPENLSDAELAGEIRHRAAVVNQWKKVYRDEFIPLAHGIRLFGQVYNEVVQPENPFEFQDLLAGTDMISVKRNRMMADMAGKIRTDAKLAEALKSGADTTDDPEFDRMLGAFVREFGDAAWNMAVVQGRQTVVRMVLEMAKQPDRPPRSGVRDTDILREKFMGGFGADRQDHARELLALGRESYRLRDDDNLFLGRIEGLMFKAVAEAGKRIARRGDAADPSLSPADVARLLEDPDFRPSAKAASPEETGQPDARLHARQMVGQPAGPGIVRGRARVIAGASDLFSFESGEILICDAVDPNMTFVVPLAAAIVERRGGMLIHGAIIAREYGLPCVTGVPNVTRFIRTGDQVTVDGYLGIVVRHVRGV
ncbi:hypothetical protein DENIS_4427 [Desulfonema ishimotonii]|uniref:Phosphoenolpyruvate synthase n=1 Tax=Desulfonema ishimotonii TaxID=45657 RepID=A0A401G2M7_9BACT|nr:PEP/pyruvate-binding domain-containing protein [Desulfonema ishimotonii]GBC63433.1 hypothetical protein DENIS_4427 [Desulfonema ishimotonii]